MYNVVKVRSQPGGAGTVLNNLAALGIGAIYTVGFIGDDGEGFELRRELQRMPSVCLDHLLLTSLRRTFTYCKPLVIEPGKPPRELNRLDSKNWTPTPLPVESHLCESLRGVAEQVDAILIMDQVDRAETGVITSGLLRELDSVVRQRPGLLVLADSRRGLRGYPAVSMKMNRLELGMLLGCAPPEGIDQIGRAAAELAAKNGRSVFVTLAEQGLLAATPTGEVQHLPSLPVRGPIDIVGAGDAVSANLAAALAAGASLRDAVELANAAASIVIHQLGTTGTASVPQLAALLAAQ